MQLWPIISSLRHHRLTSVLLALQISFTCAIVCNIIFLIVTRIDQITLPTGIVNNQLSVIQSNDLRKGDNSQAQIATDLAMLRAIPGVENVVVMDNSLPLTNTDHSDRICNSLVASHASKTTDSTTPGCTEASVYSSSSGLIKALGIKLSEGRDFKPEEYVDSREFKPNQYITTSTEVASEPAAVIITHSLAVHLFPDTDALGKSIYTGTKTPLRIVGIMDKLLRPSLRAHAVNYYSMLLPVTPNFRSVLYVLRSRPQDRQRILKDALTALNKLNPERMTGGSELYSRMRHRYFENDYTMINLLLASALGLLIVTAIGIMGLASFWVQQRTKQIGIRRAVGATRGDILRYFQLENFLIVSVGVFAGLVLAVGLNLVLMQHNGMQPLPWYYLMISAIVLWLLGQLAVLKPALRAASVPPSTATRNV